MLLWKRVYIWSWFWNLHAFLHWAEGRQVCTLSSPGAWWDRHCPPTPRITWHLFPAPSGWCCGPTKHYLHWMTMHPPGWSQGSWNIFFSSWGAMSLLLILENVACCFSSWAVQRQLRKGGSVFIWVQSSIPSVLPGIVTVSREAVSSNCCLLRESCMHFLISSSGAPGPSLCRQRWEAQNQNPDGLSQAHDLPILPNQQVGPRETL